MVRVADDALFWDRVARRYAAAPIADMEGYERELEHTRRYLKSDDTAFEFGCGTGTTALRLAPFLRRIVATDMSGGMIAIARERAEAGACGNVTFAVATPDAAPWPDETFDVALGFNVLHLVAARDAALRGVHRLLKPGGLLISRTPCLKEMNPALRIALPVMRVLGRAPRVAFLSAGDMTRETELAGFEIVERARHASRGGDATLFLVARRR